QRIEGSVLHVGRDELARRQHERQEDQTCESERSESGSHRAASYGAIRPGPNLIGALVAAPVDPDCGVYRKVGTLSVAVDSPSVVIAEPSIRRGVIPAYFALTKPRIIELLLITTVPAMVLAAGGWPGWWPVLATLIGGSLSAGGANAINNWFDRDIDEVMRRTRRRPLPRHEIEPVAALRFG